VHGYRHFDTENAFRLIFETSHKTYKRSTERLVYLLSEYNTSDVLLRTGALTTELAGTVGLGMSIHLASGKGMPLFVNIQGCY
jgi:hypothetical protein